MKDKRKKSQDELLPKYNFDYSKAVRGNGKLMPDQEELRQLRGENKQLEREVLKRSGGFLRERIELRTQFIAQ